MSEYLSAWGHFEYFKLSIKDILPHRNLLTSPGFYRTVWVYCNSSTSTLLNILSNTLLNVVFFKYLAKRPQWHLVWLVQSVSLGKLNSFPTLPNGRMLMFLPGAASSIQKEDARNVKECCLEKKIHVHLLFKWRIWIFFSWIQCSLKPITFLASDGYL